MFNFVILVTKHTFSGSYAPTRLPSDIKYSDMKIIMKNIIGFNLRNQKTLTKWMSFAPWKQSFSDHDETIRSTVLSFFIPGKYITFWTDILFSLLDNKKLTNQKKKSFITGSNFLSFNAQPHYVLRLLPWSLTNNASLRIQLSGYKVPLINYSLGEAVYASKQKKYQTLSWVYGVCGKDGRERVELSAL